MTEKPFPLAAELPEKDVPQRIQALTYVAKPPDVYDSGMFRRYPGMKLGRMPDVDFFAEKLCDLAMEVLAPDMTPEAWVMTAPAYYHIPAGANLLAERVRSMLGNRGVSLPLVDMRLSSEQIAVRSLEEFQRSHDYSRGSLAQRISVRQRLEDVASPDPGWLRFAKRKVIIVNDIHVTGTQQHFMQRSLAEAGAVECHWLYIFYIESELARSYPEIEYRINNSALADLDSFAAILSDAGIRHTARCLSRLFNEELDDFRYLVAALGPDARERVCRLAKSEERYDIPLFSEKMQLLSGND
jgi:hypothetical protein